MKKIDILKNYSKSKIYKFRFVFLSLIIGVISWIWAVFFSTLLEFWQALFLHWIIWNASFWPFLIIVPTLWWIVSGFLVYYFAPETAWHWTDSAIYNYHHNNWDIKLRTPIIKTIASFFTIWTGWSGWQEWPIAQIGSWIASNIAKLFKLSPKDTRLLMMWGLAWWVWAIFWAPIAWAIFAAEVMYKDLDFEYEVLILAIISSITANGVFINLLWSHNIFSVAWADFNNYTQEKLVLPFLER